MKAEPFEVAVPKADLDDLCLRLARTRWADDLGNADWRYGVELNWLKEMVAYWRDDYDWRSTEAMINHHPNFKVMIKGVPLHFVRVRGTGVNPLPLLLIHGWPWTFMDFYPLIDQLADPAANGGDAVDSFDLIIPSLPGYGYSMPLTTTGLDIPCHGELFRLLMTEVLGYSRFAVVGSDWGAAITTWMGHAYPERIVGVFATIPYFPGLDLTTITPDRFAADEQWMLIRQAETARSAMSHFVVQSTDPQTLAYALVDSPAGTAAWLWERWRSWSDCDGQPNGAFDRNSLCALASIYWLTGSIGTSMRTYWEHAAAGGLPMRPLHGRTPAIEVPCGFAIFPKEVMFVPREVAAEGTNLQRWTRMPRGGHFGLAERPHESAAELKSFFAPLRS